MSKRELWSRRNVLGAAGVGVLGALAAPGLRAAADEPYAIKGNIKQSVCRWCYGKIPLRDLAVAAKRMGFKSIELLLPNEYLEIKPLGLTCAMIGGADIVNGLNRKENHPRILKQLRERVEFAAAEGLPNVICMAGNRKGMPDAEGMENCAIGLKQVLPLAEEKGVTLCMEGLNSKVDHKDYMYDHTAWGVELCKKLGSPRFKLLYDIYHMQIMEGDVIRTIQRDHECIAHYHTGGNPGRHEIDETQELHYPAVVRAILKTGYQGFLGQEFIPTRDPLTSLQQGFRICDV